MPVKIKGSNIVVFYIIITTPVTYIYFLSYLFSFFKTLELTVNTIRGLIICSVTFTLIHL